MSRQIDGAIGLLHAWRLSVLLSRFPFFLLFVGGLGGRNTPTPSPPTPVELREEASLFQALAGKGDTGPKEHLRGWRFGGTCLPGF